MAGHSETCRARAVTGHWQTCAWQECTRRPSSRRRIFCIGGDPRSIWFCARGIACTPAGLFSAECRLRCDYVTASFLIPCLEKLLVAVWCLCAPSTARRNRVHGQRFLPVPSALLLGRMKLHCKSSREQLVQEPPPGLPEHFTCYRDTT